MLNLVLLFLIGQQATDPTQLEFVRLSYKSNKDTFIFCEFRFQYTRGNSASLGDAERGVFKSSVNADGYYVFDEHNARYELIPRPQDLLGATTRIDERTTRSIVSTYRMLTDGKVTLLDALSPSRSGEVLRHRAAIFPGPERFSKALEFPLYVGDRSVRSYDLFSDLTSIKNGDASLVELDLNSETDNRKACKIAFTYKEGKRTYWVDLSRGSIPLRISDHYNPMGVNITFIFDDLQLVPNAGWIPRTRIHIIGEGEVVDRIRITDIECATRPGQSQFQLGFPEPIGLVDQARRLSYPPRKTWGLLSLPGASSPGTRKAIPESYQPPPQMPGEIEPGSRGWTLVLIGVGTVLVICFGNFVIALLRKRHRAR